MFDAKDYVGRGYNFINNQLFPHQKKLSSLMLYTTDLCDSACKHCLIWAKRPVTHLSFEKIKEIMASECVSTRTLVGLEGGEFLLHPEAEEILAWFSKYHKNFDLFSNCLKPDKLIVMTKKYKPNRLYISLDGDRDTYLHMRGKDGYDRVVKVIENLKNEVPVFVMFTLSPYNDFDDLKHVAALCEQHKVYLRVGIYNNIPFFDTIDDARKSAFGQLKNNEILTYSAVSRRRVDTVGESSEVVTAGEPGGTGDIPEEIRQFTENYDYVRLYSNWLSGKLRIRCFSILDSLIVLPNGDVPICQNLPLKLGNVHGASLDDIFNSPKTVKTQKHYSANCNQCWISYHRKYDIILYRNFEKFFGRWATSKMLGYYKWDDDEEAKYTDLIK